MYTTLQQIKEYQPCSYGWGKLLKFLGKNKADNKPLKLSTIYDSNGFQDTLWALRSVEDINFIKQFIHDVLKEELDTILWEYNGTEVKEILSDIYYTFLTLDMVQHEIKSENGLGAYWKLNVENKKRVLEEQQEKYGDNNDDYWMEEYDNNIINKRLISRIYAVVDILYHYIQGIETNDDDMMRTMPWGMLVYQHTTPQYNGLSTLEPVLKRTINHQNSILKRVGYWVNRVMNRVGM